MNQAPPRRQEAAVAACAVLCCERGDGSWCGGPGDAALAGVRDADCRSDHPGTTAIVAANRRKAEVSGRRPLLLVGWGLLPLRGQVEHAGDAPGAHAPLGRGVKWFRSVPPTDIYPADNSPKQGWQQLVCCR